MNIYTNIYMQGWIAGFFGLCNGSDNPYIGIHLGPQYTWDDGFHDGLCDFLSGKVI